MKLGKPVYDTIIDPRIVPFGKHKGESIDLLDDSYLTWITNQDWIEEKHPEFLEEVQCELCNRDSQNEELAREYQYAYHEDVYDND